LQREKALLASIAFAINELYEFLICWISIDKSSGSDSLYGKLENSITNLCFHHKCKKSSWKKNQDAL